MATNEKFNQGDNLYLPVISGTVSGGAVIVGMIPGVAITSRDTAGYASVKCGAGVHTLSVTASGNIAIGAPIYITSATYALTDAAGAGKQLFGHTITASTGTGAKTHDVRLVQFSVAVGTPA